MTFDWAQLEQLENTYKVKLFQRQNANYGHKIFNEKGIAPMLLIKNGIDWRPLALFVYCVVAIPLGFWNIKKVISFVLEPSSYTIRYQKPLDCNRFALHFFSFFLWKQYITNILIKILSINLLSIIYTKIDTLKVIW